MNIEIFPSASGDCLLITSSDGRRILADAGLPEAYDEHIAAPLAELRDADETIDVAYVSHIDRDHIGGILRLLDDEVRWRAFEHGRGQGRRLREPSVPRPPAIGQIWHNAFLEDIERTEAVDIGAALSSSAGFLSGLNAALADPAAANLAAEVRMLSLSVGDAIEVNWRIGEDQLGIALNPDFSGGLMTSRPKEPIPVGSLAVQVLGPTASELAELRRDWIAWLRKRRKTVESLRRRHQRDLDSLGAALTPETLAGLSREFALAVEKDVTPPNLASLVLLVQDSDGRRILLTGDAGDESLLRYLEAADLLDSEGRIDLDVLKVPHHGAHNSFSPEFVQRVRADHYIFCGDGEHDNPEHEVVAGYIKAVRSAPLGDGRKAKFWFNWSSARATRFRGHWDKLELLFERHGVSEVIERRSLGEGERSMVLDWS